MLTRCGAALLASLMLVSAAGAESMVDNLTITVAEGSAGSPQVRAKNGIDVGPSYRIHSRGTVVISVGPLDPSKFAVRVRKIWMTPAQPAEDWYAFANAPVQPPGPQGDAKNLDDAEKELKILETQAAAATTAEQLRRLIKEIEAAKQEIDSRKAFDAYHNAVRSQENSTDSLSMAIRPGQEFALEISVTKRDPAKAVKDAPFGQPNAITTIVAARSSSRVEAGIGYGAIFGNNSGFTITNGAIQDRRANDIEPSLLGYVHFVSGDRSAEGLVRGLNGLTGRIFSLDSSNTRVAFSLGTPIAGTNRLRAYVLGATLLLGENQEIGVTIGAAFARYTRLAHGYAVGQTFAGSTPPTENPIRMRPFLGLSYSFR